MADIMADKGVTLLRDYNGNDVTSKIDRLLKDVQNNPKLQAVKTSLPAFIRYVDTMDSFATLVKTNFDMKKTLMENLEAILEKYYSVTMTQNPVQVVLEQIKEVDGTPYNEAQQKAKQKLLQWADKYIGDNTLEHKWEKSDYFTIIGKAGTGKTTVARQFMYEAIQKYYAKYNRLPNICACALSHKAKEVLANSLSPLQRLYNGREGKDGIMQFKALTGALGGRTTQYVNEEGVVDTATVFGDANLENAIAVANIILVDECSMVSPTYFRYIQEKRQSGSMLIFLGDNGQLMPIISENNKKEEIEAAKKCFEENYAPVSNDNISNGNYQNIQSVNGNSFTFLGIPKTKEEVDNYPNAAILTERVRSGEGHPLLEFADHFWNVDANDPNAWWETSTLPTKITKDGAFIKSKSEDEVIEKASDLFERAIREGDPNMVQYCCYDNATVDHFNNEIHKLMGKRLGKEDYENLPFFEGEPVYLSAANISNNNSRGVITEVSPLMDATDEWVGISRGKEIINDNLKDRKLSFKYVVITFKGSNGELYKSRFIPEIKDSNENEVNFSAFMGAINALKSEINDYNQQINTAQSKEAKDDILSKRKATEFAFTRLLNRYGMNEKAYKNSDGGREFSYTPVLRHGYASTIHRVQGSTFETVIVNFDDLYNYKGILGQNFPKAVYTAVTRASHVCVVIDNDNNIPPMNQNLTDVVDYVKNNRTSRNPNSGDIPTESEAMQLNKASLLYHDKLDKSKVGSMPWFESVQQNIEKLKETMKGNPNEDYGFISVEFLDNLAKTAQKLVQSGISYTDKLDFNVAGQYAAHNASINITPDSPVQEVYTCVHEILHLVSKYAIDVQNYTKTLSINSDKINADEFNQIIDAANRLGTAFKVFKKYRYRSLSNEEISATEYATKNVAEFIAELSNPVVHNAIQKIDETQGTGLIAEIKDILNKVIEWFSNNLRKLFKKKANEPEIKSLMDFTKKALNDLVLASNKDSFNLYTAMSRVIQSNNAMFENNSAVNNALRHIIEERENEDGTVTLTKKTKYDDKIKNPPVIPSFIKDLKGTLITLNDKKTHNDKHYYISNVVYRPQVSEYLKKDRNHFELTLTPVNDLTMGLNAVKKSIDGLGEVYALKDTEKIYNDTNLSDLYLDYKLENKAKQEDERITEVKKIVNKYDLQSNEGSMDFSMVYPMVSEELFRQLYDYFALDAPFTDDQWLQLAKEMKVKLDYGKSLSSMGIEVTSIADIENNATNPAKIKAYRVKSVDGYDPQTAFNNKIMGNPFLRWFGVKEKLKKEGVSDEEIDNHPMLLSAKRADQDQFVHWLISGDSNGNTRATKALRDAYLSIIEDAANNKANNQIMYYLDTHPYTSHAAAIQAIINNWDSIKSEVEPFNKMNREIHDEEIDIWYGKGTSDQNYSNGDLSNFANRPFYVPDGERFSVNGHTIIFKGTFPTVEHAFQYAKSYYANGSYANREIVKKIQPDGGKTVSAAEAKYLGGQLQGLDEEAWNRDKLQIMQKLMYYSFSQNEAERRKLVNTGRAKLTHKLGTKGWDKLFPTALTNVRSIFQKEYAKPIVHLYNGKWSRKYVQNHPEKVFLFGDNLEDAKSGYIPTETQAVIRGLDNAIGIPTKRNRRKDNSSYFNNNDLEEFKKYVDDAIQKALESGKEIVIPNDGIGTGKAELPTRAPELYSYLMSKLKSLNDNSNQFEGHKGKQMFLPAYDNKSGDNAISTALQGYNIHSGGAVGADSIWEQITTRYGASYKGYYIEDPNNPNNKPPKGNIKVIWCNNEEEVEQKTTPTTVGVIKSDALTILGLAAERLSRNVAKMASNKDAQYAYNLILRDYVQVIKSDQVIAVGELSLATNQVAGGTGYAVEMAKVLNISGNPRPIYVFNTLDEKWYKCSNDTSYGVTFFESAVPTLTKNTACIGTRGPLDDRNQHVFASTWKQAMEDVVNKTILRDTKMEDWDSVLPTLSKSDRERLANNLDSQGNTAKSDFNDYLTDESKNNVVEVTTNAEGITEYSIRRVSKDMTEENKTLTVRSGTALFNELMNHQAKRGDIVRVQTDKSLIMRTIDSIESDGTNLIIHYSSKQTINYSGIKLRSNSPSQLTANIKELKAAQDKKQSLKQQLGSDVYAQRVKYIARRLRNYVLKLKDRAVAAKAESNGQTLDENASIADTLNFFGYDRVKAGFKHSIAKHLPENVKGGEEEKALAKDDVISGWATNAVEKGIFNDIEEAKNYYSQNVFDVKMEANRQIVSDENFDTFFVDTLVQFSRDNDVDIDIYTVEKKKDKATTHTEKSETQLSDSDSTIKDAEYETVEKWQVGETHALSSASTRLKNFLNSVPLRGKDGKIKLDDISEPIFLPANRVYNQMQDLMHDCFTFTDLMDKLKKMGKNSPIYKSIYELLANDTISKDDKSDKWNGQLKKIGNQIGTELFILLNNEEIEYENWYTDYLGKGDERIKRFNVKYENPANAAKDTLSIVTRNANEGVSYVSAKHNQPQFNKRNLGKDSITKDEANVYSAWMGVIYNYSSASEGYFSDLLGKDFDNIEKYKNRVNSDKVKGDIKAIRNILWSLGYTIDEEDLMDNFNNTSERSFPMVDICNAIQSFMQRFQAALKAARTKKGKASPDDVTNLAKYLETKEGKSLMYTLCTVCPMTSKVADKQSVTYINGNNYPKFKPVSSLGSLLKHIKDPNKERRERYIQEQFKNISWFYSTGNIDEIREKLNNLSVSDNLDKALIADILNDLAGDVNEDAINKKISLLSAETKGKLINERHPSDSIVTVPKWNNVTIQKIMDSQVIANKVKRHRIVAFNKNGYFKWDKDDFSLMALDKFYQYDSTDSAYADFLMPIYSDAGVMEFITLPKVGNPAADYESRINACVDSLMMSYRQELGRIKLIKERKQWRLDSVEAFNAFMSNKSRESLANDNQKACYDDYVEQANRTSKESVQVTDGYYYSLPIQNLEDVESLKWNGSKWVLETSKDGQGKYFNFFSFLYKYAPNIESESLSESQVRNYVMEELKTEALRLQDVVDNNKYGHYDVQKKYAKKERDKYTSYRRSKDETHNRNIFDRLFEFTCENMCAHIAIVEMTVTDMAQYKDAIDFQKRFKEVYAGTKRLNTTYHPIMNPYAREDYAQILLKDIFRKNRNTGDFEALVRASDLPKAQKEWLIKTYGKINLTDAQSYRSLSSMRAVMSMSGEWRKSYDKIFDKLEKGEQLTMKELQTFFQPRKPFVFTHKFVDAKNSADKQHNDKMKIGFQIKNSEFLLMYIYSQTNTLKGVNGAAIRGLNQFMEDNRLDCIHFNSGIKVGGQGAIDIDNAQLESRIKEVNPREYDMEDITERRKYYDALEKSVRDAAENGTIDQEEYQRVKETVKQRPTERWRYENLYKEAFQKEQDRIFEDTQKLLYKISGLVKHNKEYDSNNNEIKETDDEKLARLKAANPEFINIIPYSEYGIISSTPEHFMGKKQKLGTQLMRLLTSDNLGTTYKVKAGGQELSLDGKHVFYHLSKLLAAKALIHHDKIDQTFKNDDDLLAYLLKQMQGNDKYSPATMDAIQYKNENGKLVLLGDNVVRKQIESLLNSFIREEINDVELDGGTCIQVTAALSDDLKIKYTKDAQGNRIKYWECRMPIALKEVYNLAADEKGFLSVENLMNNKLINQATKEKLLKCIGCRVPTESKHSIQHLKCVEFLPSNSGSCIMLPYEITKTSGADFDIDKLYLWRYSFEMVEMEHDGRKIKIPKYVDYANEEIHKMSEKQINNAIIDLFWTVLEHPASAMQELIPNSYDNTQKAAYIGTLFHGEGYNKVIERKFNESEEEKAKQDPDYVKREYTQKNKLKFLQEMDIDTLQSWYSIGLNRCSLLNQTYFFDLNSKGKGMLGIMAVNNVFLSLLQHTKVSVRPQYAVTINGHTPYKLYERTVNKDGEKYLSSLTLSEFLAAAPDSAKDPTLVFLGINNQNVNALVGAALLNYDIQDIALMFNHPVLKEFFSDVKAGARLTANDVAMKIIRMFTPEEDGIYDYENTHPLLKQALSYDETGETYKNKQGKDVPIRELHPHDTSGLKEFDISMDDLLGESDPNDISDDSKIKILVAFYKMFQVGSALNNLAQVTRQDSTSGSTSATMSGDISKWQKIKRVMKELTYKDSPLNIGGALLDTTPLSDDIDPNDEATRKSLIDNIGNEHDNPLGYIQVQLTYGLMNAFKYGKNRLPNFSPFLMKCYETLAETTPYGYLNEDVIELLVNDFLKWKLSNIPFFGSQMVEIKNQKTGNTESYYMPLEQKMSIIVNETWEDINTVKMEYNLANNKLLNSLKTNKLGVIILEDAGQLTQEEKKDLTEAWEDLLNSPYDRVRMLGYNLIRYSFYRNTMKFAPDGFGHLCPDVRKTIPGYVQAMEESLTQKEDGYAAFLSRFVANNAKYLQTTKKRNLRDDQESWIQESNMPEQDLVKAEREMQSDDVWNQDDVEYSGFDEEASFEDAKSADIGKSYSFVLRGTETEKEEYYKLMPAQIVPTTNLYEWERYESDGTVVTEVNTVDSKTNDFTYYPQKDDADILPFIETTDNAWQTNSYKKSTFPFVGMETETAERDMYDELQELKDKGQLISTTNIC